MNVNKKAKHQPKKFISINGLIDRWSVSRATVYRVIKSANLPIVTIGVSKRILLDVIEKYESDQLLPARDYFTPKNVEGVDAKALNHKRTIDRLKNRHLRKSSSKPSSSK